MFSSGLSLMTSQLGPASYLTVGIYQSSMHECTLACSPSQNNWNMPCQIQIKWWKILSKSNMVVKILSNSNKVVKNLSKSNKMVKNPVEIKLSGEKSCQIQMTRWKRLESKQLWDGLQLKITVWIPVRPSFLWSNKISHRRNDACRRTQLPTQSCLQELRWHLQVMWKFSMEVLMNSITCT